MTSCVLNFLEGELERTSKASAIILHMFEALEGDILDALSLISPPKIYPIGPLQLQLDQIKDNNGNNLDHIGSSLWKEEGDCVEWLNSKEPNSVVYVNLGSVRVLTKEQVIELAWGLANSEQSFLWVIRPDLVKGGIETETLLPQEFADGTKERGLIASWCPQEQVPNHPAIEGFLTHNGWNSSIESITAGVPMICWPFSSEQRPNSSWVCTEWEIGMAVDEGGNGGSDHVLVGGK